MSEDSSARGSHLNDADGPGQNPSNAAAPGNGAAAAAAATATNAAFQSLDLRSATAAMEALFEQVVRRSGRIEITRGDSGESCVLISKAELDGLEQALEILAGTDSGAALRDTVLRAAEAVAQSRPTLVSGAF